MGTKRTNTGSQPKNKKRVTWADKTEPFPLEDDITDEAIQVSINLEAGNLNYLKRKIKNKTQEECIEYLTKIAPILVRRLSAKLCANAFEFINYYAPHVIKQTICDNSKEHYSYFSRLIHHLDLTTQNGKYYNIINAKRILRIFITHAKERLVEDINSYEKAISHHTSEVFLSAWDEAFKAKEVALKRDSIKEYYRTTEEYLASGHLSQEASCLISWILEQPSIEHQETKSTQQI